jgi:hypothetical protein
MTGMLTSIVPDCRPPYVCSSPASAWSETTVKSSRGGGGEAAHESDFCQKVIKIYSKAAFLFTSCVKFTGTGLFYIHRLHKKFVAI